MLAMAAVTGAVVIAVVRRVENHRRGAVRRSRLRRQGAGPQGVHAEQPQKNGKNKKSVVPQRLLQIGRAHV